MKCDIVMPVWNKEKLTRQCLDSIFKNTDCDYRIIIIDNASDSPTGAYLEEVKNSRPDRVCLIRNNENIGFTKAANQGIKSSTADYICVINNDIIVFDGWLSEMMRVAGILKDIGIVNPSGNSGGKKGEYIETAAAIGFCYLIKRAVIDKIGLFDERFSPGYFEDTDYSIRARYAGYKIVFAKGAHVFHFEHSSFIKRGFNSFFKQSEEKFYRLHKRPDRVLYVLTKPPGPDFQVQVRRFLDEGAWVTVFLKKSAPKIELPNHTYVRAFYFADLFFDIKVYLRILFKKKKFTKVFREAV